MSTSLCTIVGAGPGVSLAVARRFGREGFRIALIARREEALADYQAELVAAGVESVGFAGDAGDARSLCGAFERITNQLGTTAVLIYNVAANVPGTPSTLDSERLVEAFRSNVVGALLAAQQVIPQMQSSGSGTILLTGGGLAFTPRPQAAALAVGKAGLRNLAYSLAAELEPLGIHAAIVTIAGMVQAGTPFDPDRIADAYWQLHIQPAGQWEPEIIFRG
jgi:short-subunit dehydrogenase